MTKLKTYIKRLSDNEYLKQLKPAEFPRLTQAENLPKFLTKQEIKKIMEFLERFVAQYSNSSSPYLMYTAYLRRALVRMLYTT